MQDYFNIFEAFGFLNSLILIIGSWISIKFLNKNYLGIFKIVSAYILIAFFFDTISRITTHDFLKSCFGENVSASLRIIYRLFEVVILGYMFNKYCLKNKIIWFFIGVSSVYLLYELLTFEKNGILNYDANAITLANTLLLILGVFSMLKSMFYVKDVKLNNLLLCMIFVAYFAIHLIYTVIHNFLINQKFTDKSFAIFYSSYAILHLIFYGALTFILYREYKLNKKVY